MTWENIKSWFKHSMTLVVARGVVVLGVVLEFADVLSPVLNSQEVHDAISGVLDARYVPLIFIAIGVLTELARRRTLAALKPDAEEPDDGGPTP